jgi:hypothetical protein
MLSGIIGLLSYVRGSYTDSTLFIAVLEASSGSLEASKRVRFGGGFNPPPATWTTSATDNSCIVCVIESFIVFLLKKVNLTPGNAVMRSILVSLLHVANHILLHGNCQWEIKEKLA